MTYFHCITYHDYLVCFRKQLLPSHVTDGSSLGLLLVSVADWLCNRVMTENIVFHWCKHLYCRMSSYVGKKRYMSWSNVTATFTWQVHFWCCNNLFSLLSSKLMKTSMEINNWKRPPWMRPIRSKNVTRTYQSRASYCQISREEPSCWCMWKINSYWTTIMDKDMFTRLASKMGITSPKILRWVHSCVGMVIVLGTKTSKHFVFKGTFC